MSNKAKNNTILDSNLKPGYINCTWEGCTRSIYKIKLQEHIWRAHTKEKPFPCNYQAMNFLLPYNFPKNFLTSFENLLGIVT